MSERIEAQTGGVAVAVGLINAVKEAAADSATVDRAPEAEPVLVVAAGAAAALGIAREAVDLSVLQAVERAAGALPTVGHVRAVECVMAVDLGTAVSNAVARAAKGNVLGAVLVTGVASGRDVRHSHATAAGTAGTDVVEADGSGIFNAQSAQRSLWAGRHVFCRSLGLWRAWRGKLRPLAWLMRCLMWRGSFFRRGSVMC
jgi:hypothetical protein